MITLTDAATSKVDELIKAEQGSGEELTVVDAPAATGDDVMAAGNRTFWRKPGRARNLGRGQAASQVGHAERWP